MAMSDYTTTMPNRDYQLTVTVRPEYQPAESSPEEGRWVFAYHVRIENSGRVPAQVIARHWIIDDANGNRIEVQGLGVVGYQPLLEPGGHFEYTSGTPLATPTGTMQGSLFCVAVDGARFEAPIAPFTLDAAQEAPDMATAFVPANHTVH